MKLMHGEAKGQISATANLEAWLSLSKAHSVSITHDDGLGAIAGWEVTLSNFRDSILVTGFNDGEYDSLDRTITRAIEAAMIKWHEKLTDSGTKTL